MVEEGKSAGESVSAALRSNHPIFARLYPLLTAENETVFATFEEC